MSEAKARLEALEAVFAALAHASRRQILMVVRFRGGVISAGDIAGRFHHAWPTISRHLRVLESAGLITHEKQGRTRYYRVNTEKLQLVGDWLRWFDPLSSVQRKRSDESVPKRRKKDEGNKGR
jgi:DNA-binding transcriptional ArsR family regulator